MRRIIKPVFVFMLIISFALSGIVTSSAYSKKYNNLIDSADRIYNLYISEYPSAMEAEIEKYINTASYNIL